ncbi:MAG: hypothetical protein AB8F26_12650 [Phycisphaerales bacterium]
MSTDSLSTKQVEPRCARCGYSLVEQRVFVQEDLGMSAVRCPECGLGQGIGSDAPPRFVTKSVSVWRTFRWLVAASVVIFGTAGAIGGLAQSTGFAASVPLAEWISGQVHRQIYAWTPVQSTWWENNGEARLAASGVSRWTIVDWMVLTDLLWAIPIGLIGGLLYRAVFRNATRRGHRVAIGVILASSLIGLIAHNELVKYLISTSQGRAMHLAMRESGFVIMYGSWIVVTGCVLLGIRYGGRLLDLLLLHLRGGRVAG